MTEHSYKGPETGLEHDDARIVTPMDLLDSVEEGDVLEATAERTGYATPPPTWTLEVIEVRADELVVEETDVLIRDDRLDASRAHSQLERMAKLYDRVSEPPAESEIDLEQTAEAVVLHPAVRETQRTVVYLRESGKTSPAMGNTRSGGGPSPSQGVTVERVED